MAEWEFFDQYGTFELEPIFGPMLQKIVFFAACWFLIGLLVSLIYSASLKGIRRQREISFLIIVFGPISIIAIFAFEFFCFFDSSNQLENQLKYANPKVEAEKAIRDGQEAYKRKNILNE